MHYSFYNFMNFIGVYATTPADYATALFFNWTFCVLAGLFMNMMVIYRSSHCTPKLHTTRP